MEHQKIAPLLAPPSSTPPEDDQLCDESPLPPVPLEVKKAASMRRVTIEPIILLVSIAFGIFTTVPPQYIKQRLADERNFSLSLDEDSENSGCSSVNTSDPDYIIEQEIQADTSFWLMIIVLCGYFTGLFTAPLIGAWSDKLGRKIALGLPIIGFMILTITFLLVYYLILPLWVIAVGSFLQGITGSYGLLLASCYAYIADVTTKDKRMMRIAIVQAIFVLGICFSQILVGFFIEATGFGPSFCLAFTALFGSLIYTKVPPFLIETIEPRRNSQDDKSLAKSNFERVFNLFNTNTDSRRVKLLLLLLIVFGTETSSQGSLNLTIIYGLGPPFCWSSVLVGWYSAVVLFVKAGGMIAGTKGLALCLADDWILQVGMIVGIIYGLSIAFAESTLGLFLAAALTFLRSVEQPMFHLMLSKLVSADEQGVMFACESSILNLASFCSPLILNNIYSATVANQPNFVFLMIAVLRLLLISVIGTYQVVIRCTRHSSTALPAETNVIDEESKNVNDTNAQ